MYCVCNDDGVFQGLLVFKVCSLYPKWEAVSEMSVCVCVWGQEWIYNNYEGI